MKKFLSVLFLSFLIATLFAICIGASNVNSGNIGSCTWQLEGTELVISGNGSMQYSQSYPWGKDITSLVINEGVTEISMSAFNGCEKLARVQLPSTLKAINHSAFSGCRSLSSINIPDGVVTIGGSVFDNCEALVEIKIPKTTTSIETENFNGCYRLASISVDENNPSFKSVDGILFNKTMTTLIKYPQSKTGNSYTVPSSVTSIGYKAFDGNWQLYSIDLHDNIKSIGMQAFTSTSMRYSSENHEDGIFYLGKYLILAIDNEALGHTVREGTTVIADGAFASCRSMNIIYIPDGVITIGSNAFAWCKALSKIFLPSSIERVGDSAFYDCNSIKDVYFRGESSDRSKILVGIQNTSFTGATWTYNACTSRNGHSFGRLVVTQEPSCETEGTKTKVCRICGVEESESIAKTGHDYSIISEMVPPTCAAAGVRQSICSRCYGSELSVIEPVDHVFGHWITDAEPSCTEEGAEKRVCIVCQRIDARNIPMIEHSYGEFYTETDATYFSDGLITATCTECGAKVSEVVPKLEFNATSFSTVMTLFSIILHVIGGIVLLACYPRKR